MLVEKMHRNIKPRGGNLQARASLLVATTLSRDSRCREKGLVILVIGVRIASAMIRKGG